MPIDPRISTRPPSQVGITPRYAPAGTQPLTPSPTSPLRGDAVSLTDKARIGASPSLSDVVAKAKEAAAKQPEWTLTINLAASLQNQFGAVYKGQQLRDLAKETEGKPVTIVAQQLSEGKDGPMIERFVIKDGKVTSQGQVPSKGFLQDLEDLTKFAAKDHPGKRMGLIIQSHGNAVDGMAGDNGGATLPELADAMKKGLAAGGREKWDLLDFDACLMGHQEVLSAMSGLADHVVASPEVELAESRLIGEKADGQPTREMVRALLANPEMDAAAFAQKAVELAAQAEKLVDYDGDGKADPETLPFNSLATLTHFDMARMPAMTQAVDQLGAALKTAMQDPKARAAIADLISRTPRFAAGDAEGNGQGLQQRDLKAFVEGLQAAISDGRIKDPSGALKKASTAAMDALGDLVKAYHGDATGNVPGVEGQDYGKLGGMGIFLPSPEFLQGTPATLSTPMQQITVNAEYFAEYVLDPEMTAEERGQAKAFFLRGAAGAMSELWGRLPEDQKGAFNPLREAYFALQAAETPEAISQAAKRYAEEATKLQDGPIGKLITEQKQNERRELVEEAFSLANPHMPAGWRQFAAALRNGA